MPVMGVHKKFAYEEGGVSPIQFFGGIFGIVSILQSPHAGKQGYREVASLARRPTMHWEP